MRKIYVDTGTGAMVGIYPFRVECDELVCDTCYLRFKCWTQRDELGREVETDWVSWAKHSKEAMQAYEEHYKYTP